MRFIGRKNRQLLEKFAPSEMGNFQAYRPCACRWHRAVARLHNAGLAHSDLTEQRPRHPQRGASIVIDVDSLSSRDCIRRTGWHQANIAQRCCQRWSYPQRSKAMFPNARTDLHALAVLVYQYLLLRHPLDGKRIPNAQSAEEPGTAQFRFGSACTANTRPIRRTGRSKIPYPSASLGRSSPTCSARVVTGSARAQHRPSAWSGARPGAELGFAVACAKPPVRTSGSSSAYPTMCAARSVAQRPAGSVPLLQLRRERARGSGWSMVNWRLYHNLSLFKWHVFTDVLARTGSGSHTSALFRSAPGAVAAHQSGTGCADLGDGQSGAARSGRVLRRGETFRLARATPVAVSWWTCSRLTFGPAPTRGWGRRRRHMELIVGIFSSIGTCAGRLRLLLMREVREPTAYARPPTLRILSSWLRPSISVWVQDRSPLETMHAERARLRCARRHRPAPVSLTATWWLIFYENIYYSAANTSWIGTRSCLVARFHRWVQEQNLARHWPEMKQHFQEEFAREVSALVARAEQKKGGRATGLGPPGCARTRPVLWDTTPSG